MSDGQTSGLRKILLAVWGMATLTLVFCVFLLMNLLQNRGQTIEITGQEAAPPPPPAALAQNTDTRAETREVILYFASLDGRLLMPESQRLPLGESTIENCRTVLEFLVRGPRGRLNPVIPNTARFRGVYLLDHGELVIDFDPGFQTETSPSVSAEALMVYSIVNTLAQPGLVASGDPAIRYVRFLFGGAPPTDRFPAHLDLSNPVPPDSSWIAATAGA